MKYKVTAFNFRSRTIVEIAVKTGVCICLRADHVIIPNKAYECDQEPEFQRMHSSVKPIQSNSKYHLTLMQDPMKSILSKRGTKIFLSGSMLSSPYSSSVVRPYTMQHNLLRP